MPQTKHSAKVRYIKIAMINMILVLPALNIKPETKTSTYATNI